MAPAFWAAVLGFALAPAALAMADEAPKYGGILTFMIPADAPPSFDAHREGTFATVHSAAPFYSVLIRVDPNNPSSTTDFVCDLCTAMPQPTDGGKTYTFKIRDSVKFHDGSPLTAADVAASWEKIIHPPEGVLSPRESHYMMVDTVEALDSRVGGSDRSVQPKAPTPQRPGTDGSNPSPSSGESIANPIFGGALGVTSAAC